MDLTFKTPEGRFNHRVAGLLMQEGRVLIMMDQRSPYYYLPGGRIALHETSGEAIVRELREELHTEVTVQRLCYVAESYFIEEVSGERFHEVCFYYQLEPSEELLSRGTEFYSEEGQKRHFFRWASVSELQDLYFQPVFLKGRLQRLPEQTEHLVIREY